MSAAIEHEAAATGAAAATSTSTAASRGAAVPGGSAAPSFDARVPDVFSFTVEVIDGRFEWLYFGPNSAVLLGDQLCARDTCLEELLRGRCLREDARALGTFLASAASGRPCEVEVRMQGADGDVRWVLWRVMPRRQDGRTFLDGVATDVSSRRVGATNHQALLGHLEQRMDSELLREHAAIVRDANDAVLQRIFAAGLRLRMLQRGLAEGQSHAAEAIAFQLDQAANDLRHTILELDNLSKGRNTR